MTKRQRQQMKEEEDCLVSDMENLAFTQNKDDVFCMTGRRKL